MNKMLTTLITYLLLSITAPVLADENSNVEFYNSASDITSSLPFSEMVRVGNTLYLSGQIPVMPGTLKIVAGGMKEQAKQTMENIKSSLESHGYSMSNIVKCTVMLGDMSEWGAFNEVYTTFFKKPYPARSAFGASGLAMGSSLEVECIGAVK